MIDEIKKKINIKKFSEIKFHKINGIALVFITETITTEKNILSYEIKPLGIIYSKKNNYYFAPLTKNYDIQRIVKEYVKNIIKEEEYPHFQQ